MSQASCFTFLRPVPPQRIALDAAVRDVRDFDLSNVEGAADQLMNAKDDHDTALFVTDEGWTVVYQNNCFPDQLVNSWLASRATEQGVVVFWNVNSVTEFSLWEHGEQVVTFEWAYDRDGTDPDRLNAEMHALGIPLDEPSDDDVEGDDFFATYAQLMALAERITGVHLDENFLAHR